MIKISAVFQVSSRRDSRGHETTLVITRKTNRRHLTGNPHGQMARKATLLVRAADEILGTYRGPVCGVGDAKRDRSRGG